MKTKIIATIGPTSDSEDKISQLIKAGVVCFRFNLKHSDLEWHQERIERVRKVAKELGKRVALLLDLQGPEVRIGKFAEGKIDLKKGETIAIAQSDVRSYKTIPLPNQNVLEQLKQGQTIFLDDAFLELKVTEKRRDYCLAKVVLGGELKSTKGANFPDLDLDLPTLLEKDFNALTLAQRMDIDFVGLSFVRTAKDIVNLRRELNKRKIKSHIIAKIETTKAVENFEAIIEVADVAMVARGDLAVEFAFEKIPFIQKEMINICRMKGKPVIVATQMLQSMINNPLPTRAEVSDVANAIYDGTDCVMLSGETADGKYPVETVAMMAKIIEFTEDKRQKEIFQVEAMEMDEVIDKAVFEISKSEYALNQKIKKIVVLTETGKTSRLISRFRPNLDIIAVSQRKETIDKLLISYGVKPFYFKFPKGKLYSFKEVLQFLKKKKVLTKGEMVILTHGEHWGIPGRTNTLRLQKIY